MRIALFLIALIVSLSSAEAQLQLVPAAPKPDPAKLQAMREKKEKEQAEKAAKLGVNAANFPRRLKQEEFKARFFNGTTLDARGLGGASFQVAFFPDGKAERVNLKTNETKIGKWRFLNDSYCSKWQGEVESCYTLVQDGDVVKVVRGTRAISVWLNAPDPNKPEAVIPSQKIDALQAPAQSINVQKPAQ